MKFIQSFWTKPILNNERKLRINSILYKISSFLIKKNFPNSELVLVTDSVGANLLETEYYDSIRLDFDHSFFDSIDDTFWAIPKILCLLKHEAPYIHLDGDFFITNKEEMEKKFNADYDIIVQNKEIGDTFQKHYKDQLKITYDLIKWQKPNANYAYNCGVLGFKNQKAANRYITDFIFMWSICNHFLQDFKKELHLFKYTDLNCIIEQHGLAETSFKNNFNVKEIITPIEFIENGWCSGVPHNNIFFHPMGLSKYSEKLLQFLEQFFEKYKKSDIKDIPNMCEIIKQTKDLSIDMDQQLHFDQLKIYKDMFANNINSWRFDPKYA